MKPDNEDDEPIGEESNDEPTGEELNEEPTGEESNEEALLKGLNVSFRFLSYRSRSIKELRERLEKEAKSKGYLTDVHIEATVEYLIREGYLNDENFAREITESKQNNKDWGATKIAFELRKKGIPADIIDKVLKECGGEGEIEAAGRALAKWIRVKGHDTPLTSELVIKANRHLSSKGFSSYIINLSIDKTNNSG